LKKAFGFHNPAVGYVQFVGIWMAGQVIVATHNSKRIQNLAELSMGIIQRAGH
jgi:hypothetical protein